MAAVMTDFRAVDQHTGDIADATTMVVAVREIDAMRDEAALGLEALARQGELEDALHDMRESADGWRQRALAAEVKKARLRRERDDALSRIQALEAELVEARSNARQVTSWELGR